MKNVRGVQGATCKEATQCTENGLDILTVSQGDGSEGAAEAMEPDLQDARPLEHTLQHVVHTVRRDGAAVSEILRSSAMTGMFPCASFPSIGTVVGLTPLIYGELKK